MGKAGSHNCDRIHRQPYLGIVQTIWMWQSIDNRWFRSGLSLLMFRRFSKFLHQQWFINTTTAAQRSFPRAGDGPTCNHNWWGTSPVRKFVVAVGYQRLIHRMILTTWLIGGFKCGYRHHKSPYPSHISTDLVGTTVATGTKPKAAPKDVAPPKMEESKEPEALAGICHGTGTIG